MVRLKELDLISNNEIDNLYRKEICRKYFSDEDFVLLSENIMAMADDDIPNPYYLPKYNKLRTSDKSHNYRGIRLLKKKKGIYFLFEKITEYNNDYDENTDSYKKGKFNLVYIGITGNNILDRIRNHNTGGKRFVVFSYIEIKNEFLAKVLESIYIYKFKPKYNKIY